MIYFSFCATIFGSNSTNDLLTITASNVPAVKSGFAIFIHAKELVYCRLKAKKRYN